MDDEWQKCRWGDIATLQYGKALRGYENADGDYPVYGTNGPVGWHTTPLCTHPGVIIGRKGAYRGVHYSSTPFYVIDTAFYLEPKQALDTRWAYYELLTHDINHLDSGSAIPSTSRADFYAMPVHVPPLRKQRAIADVLGALDDKIKLNRQTNETIEKMARALFKSWFVDFDPVLANAEGRQQAAVDTEMASLFPDTFEETESGQIPQGWTTSTIGEQVRVVGGSTPRTQEPAYWAGGAVHWATPKDLSSLTSPVLLDTERQITDKGLAQISSGLLPKGTVLLSSRAPVGYLAIAEVPTAINQGFIAMVCEHQLTNQYILRWAEQNLELIKSRANGTTFQEISKTNFRPIPVLVPPLPVMSKFTEIAESLHRQMVCNLQENLTLAALRDVLLPKLLSGEVRLREADETVEAALA